MNSNLCLAQPCSDYEEFAFAMDDEFLHSHDLALYSSQFCKTDGEDDVCDRMQQKPHDLVKE